MSKLQILVTSMHQTDMTLVKKMNICSDVLIANQADSFRYSEEMNNEHRFEMVTTSTRGLSRNRNIAISCSSNHAAFILFLDDDLVLHDGYEAVIEEEFLAHPEVDAIKFNIMSKGSRSISMRPIKKFRKATAWSISSSGVCGLVIRRSVLLDKNLRFNENFGAGTERYCGEDSIFLQEMLKKKVKLYLSPKYVADIYQEASTWFVGYDEKYFMVAGMVLAHMYPVLARIIGIRSAYRFSKRKDCNMRFLEILKCYHKGITTELHRR